METITYTLIMKKNYYIFFLFSLENQIYTRLHNAALKLEKLSISEDSAVQFTVSEEDYDV